MSTATAAASWLSLAHDDNGNVSTRASDAGTSNFAYDPLDRLTNETGVRQQAFGLDPNGNRLSDGSGSFAYLPNSNRLSTAHGQGVVLDAAGHTLQARGLNFQWNDAGQLQSVSQGGAVLASYAYDHRWLRMRKTTSAGTTHYHHDQDGRLIAETTGAGQASRSYVWLGDLPLAIVEHGQAGEQVLYLEADHLNSPIAAREESQRIVWRWHADAFGSVPPNQDPDGDGQHTIINLRFPGQYYDAEAGLHQNWHRTYDPLTGRYISVDPIGLKGGLNVFQYADGNPSRFSDQMGLQANSGQVPPPSIPGGPWVSAGPGQPPGTFYGPQNRGGGPRDVCRYVPDGANGGPKGAREGYWKIKESGKPWSRFDLGGRPITPIQAHPGNRPVLPTGIPGFGPIYLLVCPLCEVVLPTPVGSPS